MVDGYFNQRSALKNGQPELVDNGKAKRLEIMDKNADTKQAKLLYDVALKMPEGVEQQRIFSKAISIITGERALPIQDKVEYSAGQVAKKLGHGITANMVGRVANKLELKAEQPGQNEYGRWANSKSKYSDKETPQWLYSEKGAQAIKKVWKKSDKYKEE